MSPSRFSLAVLQSIYAVQRWISSKKNFKSSGFTKGVTPAEVSPCYITYRE